MQIQNVKVLQEEYQFLGYLTRIININNTLILWIYEYGFTW